MARLKLDKLLNSPELSIKDYQLLGELTLGQRIDQGDERGLTQDEWLMRIDLFNQKYPEFSKSR